MLKIRLQKIGKKNSSSYRIALVEHTTSPQGKFIELLGSYSPKLKEKKFNKERIEYWLTKGAQASPTVHNLLVDEKIIDKEKVKAWKPKKKISEVPPAAPTTVGAEVGKEQVIPEAPKVEEPIKAEEQKIEEAPKEEIKEAVPTEVGIPTEVGKEPKPHLPAEALAEEGEIPNIDTQEKKE